jgi:hypothetical protein
MRAPLVLGEKSQQISGEVADYHEGDIVEYETHDALPKTGIAPAIFVAPTAGKNPHVFWTQLKFKDTRRLYR